MGKSCLDKKYAPEPSGIRTIFYTVEPIFSLCTKLTLIGTETETEVRMSDGRIDLVVKTPDYIYVIELKLDRSAEEAMAQIRDKEYDLPYRNDGRRIFRIGVNFSSKTRYLEVPQIEEMENEWKSRSSDME